MNVATRGTPRATPSPTPRATVGFDEQASVDVGEADADAEVVAETCVLEPDDADEVALTVPVDDAVPVAPVVLNVKVSYELVNV